MEEKTTSFPAFAAETSSIAFSQLNRPTHVLYLTVLGALLGALALLPVVRVHVSSQAPGTLRPQAAKTELRPLVPGTIVKLRVQENQAVRRGDTLLVLQSDALQAQLALNAKQQGEQRALLADLSSLTAGAVPAGGWHTALYGQQAAQLTYQQRVLGSQLEKSGRELATARRLYAAKVIARVELEDKTFAHRKLQDELRVLIETQRSQWQADLKTHTAQLAELLSQRQQLAQQQRQYALVAPVAGTIQQAVGKYVGSAVQAGELLGTISPDGALLAECFLSPKDIGFLRPGLPVRFQVEAFDYNQWGMLEGQVSSVSRDFVLVEGQPVFRVLCRLHRSYLQLPSGYRGNLRKGMTVRARFLLARRSLWQLLFDKADDWLNPAQQQPAA